MERRICGYIIVGLFVAAGLASIKPCLAFGQREGEFLVDTTSSSPANAGQQLWPAVANGNGCHLMVWTDYRYGIPVICGSRIDLQGVTMDTFAIPVSKITASQDHPAVAFDGTNYLVVWREQRERLEPGQNQNAYDIYGARVSMEGLVLDLNAIRISNALNHSEDASAPKIAFDGTNYLVVWKRGMGAGSNLGIYAARVTPAGTVLDPSGIRISGHNGFRPTVTFGASCYMVAWHEYAGASRIFGARVLTSGQVLDTAGIAISNLPDNQRCPCAGFDGVNFMVAWAYKYDWRDYQIRGCRVSQTGQVLDSIGFPISFPRDSFDSPRDPSIAFDGTNYLVVWDIISPLFYSRCDLQGTRVSPTGIVLDPTGIRINSDTADQKLPAIAFNGTNYLVVWQDNRKSWWRPDYDTRYARVTTRGRVLDPHGVQNKSYLPDRHSFSCAAYDGTNYLVVWQDYEYMDYEPYGWGTYNVIYSSIVGIRIDPQGSILDTMPIDIGHVNGSRLIDQTSPAVAFDGVNYCVVYSQELLGLMGIRISPSGNMVDTAAFKIYDGYPYWSDNPAIAFDGSNYLVVFDNIDFHHYPYNFLRGIQVTTSGQVIDTMGIMIDTLSYPYLASNPQIAFDGFNYLVVWSKYQGGNNSDIYGSRVTTGGVIIDSGGFIISNAANEQTVSNIAFDGTNYLVVWQDTRNNIGGVYDTVDVYGSRVTPNGIVLDPGGIAISVTPDAETSPRVAFDGTNYLVTWENYTSDSTCDIRGCRVTPAGQVLGSFVVAAQEGDQIEPYLARGSGNQVLVTYTGWTPAINGRPAKIPRIWGKLYPFAATEEHDVLGSNGMILNIKPNPGMGRLVLSARYSGGDARLKIYDATGRLVRIMKLAASERPTAITVLWDGSDDGGRRLPAGIYFIQMKSGNALITRKAVLTW